MLLSLESISVGAIPVNGSRRGSRRILSSTTVCCLSVVVKPLPVDVLPFSRIGFLTLHLILSSSFSARILR